MYSDAFPAVSSYAAGKLKFLFFEGKDKQTKAIPKKTAGKASKKTEARQSTVVVQPPLLIKAISISLQILYSNISITCSRFIAPYNLLRIVPS